MPVTFRQPTAADAPAIGRLVFDAFAAIHDRHNFPRDFSAPEIAAGFMQAWVAHPKVWGVVAEDSGKVVGCNFLDERDSVVGVGPICIDPAMQGHGIGKQLMLAVIGRAKSTGATRVRLMQDAFNTTSMSLYASVGFDVREPAAVMSGKIAAAPAGNGVVRPMRQSDLAGCAELCRRVHGFDRTGLLSDALHAFGPYVLERANRITAYMTAPNFWPMNHGVAGSPDDAMSLLAGASAQLKEPISLLVPTRNAAFFRWCLNQKMRNLKPMTLMTFGEYQEPKGAWHPSVLY